jgi:NADH-quinone oxidoreductase subunit L
VTSAWTWIHVGAFDVSVAFRADPLSVVMALTVTGVGSMIHLYAIDYMDGDPRFHRFFGYMNLFVFFMLVLVLADNFLLLYLGWEGVGLCSYLLIGFWFDRKAAADAAKKAFITTRIGDSALLIGIIFIWLHFHSLQFDAVFGQTMGWRTARPRSWPCSVRRGRGEVGPAPSPRVAPRRHGGPHARLGPHPRGHDGHRRVYLVVRSHAIFEASGTALTIVAITGLVTAIYAGLSAIAQDDIKRMLAYSTISQLGFMFFGAGMKAYAAAIFLLVTHAFFKALLFLCAGSVMHGVHDETDMMRFGALRRVMPLTAVAWLAGAAAMAGIPPFAGFFSKDQVIAAASQAGRVGLWVGHPVRGAAHGDLHRPGHVHDVLRRSPVRRPPHDPPSRMRIALVVLGLGALTSGFILGASAANGAITRFLEPVVGTVGEPTSGPSELVLSIISVIVALAGITLAWFVYESGRIDWVALRVRLAGPKRAGVHGFYVNDAYSNVIVAPAKAAAAFAAYVVDARIIDGAVNGLAALVRSLARSGTKGPDGPGPELRAGVACSGAVVVLFILVVRL